VAGQEERGNEGLAWRMEEKEKRGAVRVRDTLRRELRFGNHAFRSSFVFVNGILIC
jgi:hypothetical protein